MNTALKFDKTTVKTGNPFLTSKEREDKWGATMKLYEDGKYVESILAVMDYANPIIRSKFGDASQTHFQIAHGSAIVNITIENGMFKVYTPFVKLPAEAKVPLMRRVSEINFGTLSLPQVYLKGDELYFYYECAVEMCYPWKLYDILREICSNADFFDDEFVAQYGAVRTMEPKVVQMEATQKEMAWQKYQEYLTEATQSIQYMIDKRMDGFIWDISAITLFRIEYFVSPQGKVRNDIESAVRDLNNNNIQFNDRLNNVRRALAELQAISKEEFMQDLYLTDTFIPYKYYLNTQNLKENLEATLDRAGKEMNNGDYMGSTFSLQYGLMNLFFYYSLAGDVTAFIEKAMADSAGKDWKEASTNLFNAIQNFTFSISLN